MKEDVWIAAAEARPSDRGVIHHIFVYTEKYRSGIPRQKEKIFLAAYLPGDVLSVYPPGVAKKIPAGSDLVFEVHYTPIGKVRYDRSSVGIIVAKEPPATSRSHEESPPARCEFLPEFPTTWNGPSGPSCGTFVF